MHCSTPYDQIEKRQCDPIGIRLGCGLLTGESGCDSCQEETRIVTITSPVLVLERNQIPNQSASDALSWGVKWPGLEALHLLPIRCRAQECMELCFHSSTHLKR